MDGLLNALGVIGAAVAFLGCVLVIVLHFMMEARTGRAMFTTLSVITYRSKDMTPGEVVLRKTSLTLIFGGGVISAAAALIARSLG